MKSLYESILKSNNASLSSELDKKLDEFNRINSILIHPQADFNVSNVSYDYFVKWLDEDKFQKLCINHLKSTRKKTGQNDNDQWLNIILEKEVLSIRFAKTWSGGNPYISFLPFLTNLPSYSIWTVKGLFKHHTEPQVWPMSWKPEKQLDAFYHYFDKNKEEIKNHKYDR